MHVFVCLKCYYIKRIRGGQYITLLIQNTNVKVLLLVLVAFKKTKKKTKKNPNPKKTKPKTKLIAVPQCMNI